MLISVTTLSAFEYCRRKLYLERVLGLKEPPREPLILGKIRHHVIDVINKEEESIVKSVVVDESPESIAERYHSHYLKHLKKSIADHKYELEEVGLNALDAYHKVKGLVLQESDIRVANLVSFIQKNRLYSLELWEKLTPKIVSEYYLESERLGLKGIIDNIEKYEDIMVPIELKTGHAPREGAWDGHKIQLGAYLLMLSDKLGKDITRGYIRYLDNSDNRMVVMNPFLKMKIEDMVKAVNDCLAAKELPDFCNSEGKCKTCGLRERCYDKELTKKLMANLLRK